MELGLPATLIIIAAAVAVFFFAVWKRKQPFDVLKIRLVNYAVIQLLCIFVVFLFAAHLVTLLVGHPVTGSGRSGRLGLP